MERGQSDGFLNFSVPSVGLPGALPAGYGALRPLLVDEDGDYLTMILAERV